MSYFALENCLLHISNVFPCAKFARAANPEDRAEVVGNASAAAMGVQFAHEHRGPVCAPAGSLGGGENGSLPPYPGAGTFHYSDLILFSTLVEKVWVVSNMCPLRFLQGLNFLIPVLDRIRYVQSLKEIVIDVPEQSAVSLGKKHNASTFTTCGIIHHFA